MPAHDPDGMVRAAHEVTEGLKVMQCHDSTSADPRPCAGFLSVVGYESIGVRLGVLHGILRREDVGRKIRGLYGSLREMLREADDIELPGAQQDPRGGGRPR